MRRDLQTDLKRAKNNGAAKSGVQHWWHQRLTAIIMVPLFIWLIFFIHTINSFEMENILLALKKPINSILASILVASSFYHAMLGMRVIIEDYVHNDAVRISLIVLTQISCLITVIFTIVALFSIVIP